MLQKNVSACAGLGDSRPGDVDGVLSEVRGPGEIAGRPPGPPDPDRRRTSRRPAGGRRLRALARVEHPSSSSTPSRARSSPAARACPAGRTRPRPSRQWWPAGRDRRRRPRSRRVTTSRRRIARAIACAPSGADRVAWAFAGGYAGGFAADRVAWPRRRLPVRAARPDRRHRLAAVRDRSDRQPSARRADHDPALADGSAASSSTTTSAGRPSAPAQWRAAHRWRTADRAPAATLPPAATIPQPRLRWRRRRRTHQAWAGGHAADGLRPRVAHARRCTLDGVRVAAEAVFRATAMRCVKPFPHDRHACHGGRARHLLRGRAPAAGLRRCARHLAARR